MSNTPSETDLQSELDALRRQLDESRQTIVSLERRQRIDELLAEVEPIDRDVARLLTEAAVARMDEPDVALAVEDLRHHKPWLFRPAQQVGRAMPARIQPSTEAAEEAAAHAAATGDRRDLLRYLRLRRNT